MQGPARGYPLWTCFWQSLFKRILKKKAAVLEKVNLFEFAKVCFVYAFEKAFNHNLKPFNHN